MLPALSYSQSKSEKYPKQTVIGGDTVVILSLSQAVEMNQSFMEIKSKIDSVNSINDSLQSVVICEISENDKLREEVIYSYQLINKEYKKEHRLEVGKDIVLCLSVVTGFFFVTDWLNQQ